MIQFLREIEQFYATRYSEKKRKYFLIKTNLVIINTWLNDVKNFKNDTIIKLMEQNSVILFVEKETSLILSH